MRLPYILFVPLLVWLCSPASARIYQYRDKNGVVHFTDNLSEVPFDQVPEVESRGRDEKDPKAEGTQKGSEEKDRHPGEEKEPGKEAETGDDAGENRDIPIVEKLNREKAALDAEHAGLVKKRKALNRERAALKTPEEVRAYRKKVKELNKRIKAYEKRNRAFQKEVDAYNSALKEEEKE